MEKALELLIAGKQTAIAVVEDDIKELKEDLAELHERVKAYEDTFGRQIKDLDSQITSQIATLVNSKDGGTPEGWKLVEKMKKAQSELTYRAWVYLMTH